jgi:hypothetical protein
MTYATHLPNCLRRMDRLPLCVVFLAASVSLAAGNPPAAPKPAPAPRPNAAPARPQQRPAARPAAAPQAHPPARQQPNTAGRQPPKTAGRQQPNTAGRQMPNNGGRQQPNVAGRQQPHAPSGQPSRIPGRQPSNVAGKQVPHQPGRQSSNSKGVPPPRPGEKRTTRRDGSIVDRGANGRATRFQSADGRKQYVFGKNGRPQMTRVDRGNGVIQTTRRTPGGGRVISTERPVPGGVMRTVSYGRGHGYVEQPIAGRAGFVRRSYVMGGSQYAVVYRSYQYGGVDFYRPVPAYVYSPAFYAWSVQPWGPQVAYGWGWNSQPWFSVYGSVFTPYPAYASLDLWMTDYIISANLQRDYDTSTADSGATDEGGNAGESNGPSADTDATASAPPPITPELKAAIAVQVKLEMQEQQQGAAAGPAAVVPAPGADAEDTPDALKPGHTTFRVVAALSVKADGRDCSLDHDDYIVRTGALNSDGTVNVEVKASRKVDCQQGAKTQIALNDLMAMESDQQERIMDGYQVASSKNGHRNGLPKGPAAGATKVPAGETVADKGVADTLRQQQSDADNDEKDAAAQANTGT